MSESTLGSVSALKGEAVLNSIFDIDYTEDSPKINVKEFEKVVKSRRSVRLFDSTKIPEEVVHKCLDMALLAPNSSNLQPWEFYWIRSKKKRRELIDACLYQPTAESAKELFVAVARTDTWSDNADSILKILRYQSEPVPDAIIEYYKNVVPVNYQMGFFGILGFIKRLINGIVGLKEPVLREPVNERDMEVWAVKSTALACENLMLAFRAYGFDTCAIEGLDSKRVKKMLNLPRKAYVTMVISAGHRDKNGIYGPRLRLTRDKFVKEV